MDSLKRSIIKESSLTIITGNGILTCEEIIHAFNDFLENEITPNLLWDFTAADLSRIKEKHIKQIIEIAKATSYLRKKGRTAIVSPHDLAFGVSRMYEILSERDNHQIHHHVFKDLAEAISWLSNEELITDCKTFKLLSMLSQTR